MTLKATCPVWEATIDKIMGGDEEKIAFLKRVFGYGMTGVITEQCLFVLYGSGANGKSTILEVFRELLSGYAMHTTMVLRSVRGSSGSLDSKRSWPGSDGSRFVSAAEVGWGKSSTRHWSSDLRRRPSDAQGPVREFFFEYKPEFKLFIAANHKPEIQGVDHGIWRRIHLIPFDVTIPTEEIDRDLPNKLREELPGILAWAVQGCREWQEQRLNVPVSISNATAAYRAEMDIIAEFLTDRCTLQTIEKTPLGTLYAEYTEWAGRCLPGRRGKKKFR